MQVAESNHDEQQIASACIMLGAMHLMKGARLDLATPLFQRLQACCCCCFMGREEQGTDRPQWTCVVEHNHRAYDIRLRLNGPEHESTKEAKDWLGECELEKAPEVEVVPEETSAS